MPINHEKLREIQMRQPWHQSKTSIEVDFNLDEAKYLKEMYDQFTCGFWEDGKPIPYQIHEAFEKIQRQLKSAEDHNNDL